MQIGSVRNVEGVSLFGAGILRGGKGCLPVSEGGKLGRRRDAPRGCQTACSQLPVGRIDVVVVVIQPARAERVGGSVGGNRVKVDGRRVGIYIEVDAIIHQREIGVVGAICLGNPNRVTEV